MFSNCYLLQILSWIKFTHIIERSSWLCYVIKTFHTVKLFMKVPVIDIIMCLRIWRYINMNSIMLPDCVKCLIFPVRTLIGNECLVDSKFNANVQDALSVYIGIGGMWKISCFGMRRNKQFHDHFFFTYEHTNHGFLLTFVYFLCYIFSRNTSRFLDVFETKSSFHVSVTTAQSLYRIEY